MLALLQGRKLLGGNMHRGEMLRLRRKAKRNAQWEKRRTVGATLTPIQRKLMKLVHFSTKRCHLR